ncbi:MAG: hypothetical protein JWN66_884 [Sphingomonas bacterium]|uniref:BPSS1187 family protein n=1 Tax=Sphingomonas bacterium TaxID=1895847 RepID=UPI00260AF2DE|nr:hypothetical protein [Sphingomonas bacterium]MDB5703768.1 hypothetical protein [Sphingomonas bacterium]
MKAAIAVLLALIAAGARAAPDPPPDTLPAPLLERRILPSEADPAVKQFDDPNIAVTSPGLPRGAPLAVFLPGTNGKPEHALDLLRVIAGQGYRALGLHYDDRPAVVAKCPADPDPDCSARFREMRVSGTGGPAVVDNPVAEAIVPRLVATLRALDRREPDQGWGGYLDGGEPRWDRIVLSGLSQGAGMAAFIAKQHKLRRVVLFSSPWDFTGPDRKPAPWLSLPSATPMDRWQAEYNRRENTAAQIALAYAALAIPPANIRIFDLDLPADRPATGANPYHAITIGDLRYTPQWRAMYGRGADPPAAP